MIDFLSYCIFLNIGMVLGTVLGLRAMRWYWHGAKVSDKENVGLLIMLASVFYLAAKRWW